MPGLMGYDPNRTRELRRHARVAAEHLLRLPSSDDPLADSAVSTARLVRAHPEHDWLADRVSHDMPLATHPSRSRRCGDPVQQVADLAAGTSDPTFGGHGETASDPRFDGAATCPVCGRALERGAG